jgi:hypothetical protein
MARASNSDVMRTHEPPLYSSGEEIHAGDMIVFQGEKARILFVKQIAEFAADVPPSDWDFMPEDTIGVEFEDGRFIGYDGFCDHDRVTLLSRAGAT